MKDLGTRTKAAIALQNLANPGKPGRLATDSGVDEAKVNQFATVLKQNAYLTFLHSHLKTAVSALASQRKLSVVQVGANDGITGDPIRPLILAHAGRALLIEPIPELLTRLREAYAGFAGELVIENVAIGVGGDTFSLHRLHPRHWPEYEKRVGRHPTGISSFDRSMVIEKVQKRLELDEAGAEEAVECLRCPMLTLEQVIEKNGFQDLDVLQVDCEGYDVVAIKSIGSKYRPAIINFESFNLSPEDWASWQEWAHRNGYGYIQGRHDTVAIRGAKFALDY